MSTILYTTVFRKGRNLLIDEIGTHTYAEIADEIFSLVSISKYQENGQQFFLLPNIDFLIERTRFKETTIKNALSYLKKNDWIITKRKRCIDGAVRIFLFISDKFKELMRVVRSLTANSYNPSNEDTKSNDKPKANSPQNLENPDSPISNESDSTESDESYIKENKDNENNNSVNNNVSKVNNNLKFQNDVNSVTSDINLLEVPKSSEESLPYKRRIDIIAKDNNVDDAALSVSILDLALLEAYDCPKRLTDDAITITRIMDDEKCSNLPRGYNKSLSIVLKEAEPYRDGKTKNLTPRQILSISKMIDYLENYKKVHITDKREVFSWIKYQITNPDHHFKGKTFRHALNIIAKSLRKTGSSGYTKPRGYVAA